ncbi:NEDD4-binding protein 2-like isoform X1 [Haliotis cracherodii]|uniref:NEDD4-binding protein 2-like isoform X1 n=1 Tax=Haliotis cracherodii TaxID=6455 RepID=UPI0039E83183
MGDVEVVISLAVVISVIIIIVFCCLRDGRRTVQNFSSEANRFDGYPTLDLHGNSVSSAIDKLNQRLSYGGPITAITGQGHHSYGGIDKIRRAVIDYLDYRSDSYSYTVDDLNPGRIHIRPRY